MLSTAGQCQPQRASASHGGPVPATAARAALQESFFKLPFELSASVDALVKAGMEKLKESTLISAAPSAGQDDSSDDEQV